MQKLAKQVPGFEYGVLPWDILRGLRSQIKASVIQQRGDIKSVPDIFSLVKLAESDFADFDTVNVKLIQ